MGGPVGVSFSGNDVEYLIDKPVSFLVVQSGKAQFLLVKTAQTPPSVHPHLPRYEERGRHSEFAEERPNAAARQRRGKRQVR
jgi:hypothetical protein